MVVVMRGCSRRIIYIFYYIVSIIKMIEYLPLVTVAGTMIYAVIHDIYVELSEVASW